MEDNVFRFKQFEVCHGKSSMKVGVDAVLLGAWAGYNATKILDIGTGCGVISLMLAQRFSEAFIDAIDIDLPSVEEARYNFSNSAWGDRMRVRQAEFPKDFMMSNERYDLIVSNPPYFHSGIDKPSSQRERARHQDTLSVFSLLEFAPGLLKENGVLAMIFPLEFELQTIEKAEFYGLNAKRFCRIRDREGKASKRVMVEFERNVNSVLKEEELTLFKEGTPTHEYKKLCGDFYLKF